MMQGVAGGTIELAMKDVFEQPSSVSARRVPSALFLAHAKAQFHTALKEPATPTRTQRHIIRAPAMQLDLVLPADSPAIARANRKHNSKSSRKLTNQAQTFHMELADKSDREGAPESSCGSTLARPSRGNDKLGAQFHTISDSPAASSAPQLMLLCQERPASKASARLRAASASAMAIDLAASEGSPAISPPSSRHLISKSLASVPFSLPQKMRPSVSLGSLQTRKVSKLGGLLPTLSTQKQSVESIAWSMHMSRATSHTGLRGSASMVF